MSKYNTRWDKSGKAQTIEERRAYQRGYKKKWYNTNKEIVKTNSSNRYHNNPNKSINSYLKRTYDITLEEYDKMFEEQNGLCAICGYPETRKATNGTIKRLAVDHNHKTGKIRKLLCQDCNVALGLVKDDITKLQSMINYLNSER